MTKRKGEKQMETFDSLLHHQFTNAEWTILPQRLEVMKDVLLEKVLSGSVNRGEAMMKSPNVERNGSVAVLNIEGTLVPKGSWLDSVCGFESTLQLHQHFKALVADPSVERIILHVDSPGGISTGIEEFADSIFEARATKEIVGYTNTMAASAGYWLLSACENIIATKTAGLGSIGTYVVVPKNEGEKDEKLYIFQAGAKKLYGAPNIAMTQEEIDYFSNKVAVGNERFLQAVAKFRGVEVEQVKNLEAEFFNAINAPSWLYTEIGDETNVLS
jgi:ClpP class serine protease